MSVNRKKNDPGFKVILTVALFEYKETKLRLQAVSRTALRAMKTAVRGAVSTFPFCL